MGIVISGQQLAQNATNGTSLDVAPVPATWDLESEASLNLDTQGKAMANFYVQLDHVNSASPPNAINIINVIDGCSGIIVLDAGNDAGATTGLAVSVNGALVVNNGAGILTFGVDGRQVISYFYSNLLATISPAGGFLVTVGKSYT
jgi:hypothetical protein